MKKALGEKILTKSMDYKRILKIENLEKRFKKEKNPTLTELSFDLLEGEFLGIMARSGSGKTTILNTISLVGPYNRGSISYYGKDLASFSKEEIGDYRRKVISYIYQDYKLIDKLTGYENISLPYFIKDEEIKREKIEEVSKLLGIGDILNKYPKSYSGGEAQRIAIARALVKDTRIILADEPTSALDSRSAELVLKLFKSYKKEKSIIMAGHDLRAMSYTDRVIFLKDGKIYNELRRREDEGQEAYLLRIENADRQLVR